MNLKSFIQVIKVKESVAILIAIIAIMGACKKDEFNPELSENLQGKWIEKVASDNVILYEKSSSFEENLSSIEFRTNGVFVNKSDKAWVRIPSPINYNFDGTWQKISDNKYKVSTKLQGIEKDFQIEIVSVNDTQLTAKFVFFNSLKGIWVYQSENEGLITYKLSTAFDEDFPGIEFKDDGVFIQRANSGFCGTPPISYTNYEGTWEEGIGNQYKIEVPFWGGTPNYTIEVVSMVEAELKVKFIYPENK